MEKRFWNRKEVADFLRISIGTLANYGCRHAVYKPDHAGMFHCEHVQVLEKVWAKILSPDEGMNLWVFKKMRMRRSMLQILPSSEISKKRNQCVRG